MAYKPKAGDVIAAPNVIPMAVTPLLQKGVSVELAKVNNPREMQDADREDAIIVAITRDGGIYLGSTKTPKDQLTALIRDRISSRLDKTVFVKSDGRAKYGAVVAVV